MSTLTVTDLDRSRDWYAALTGRGPDAAPMAGLIEWYLGGDSAGSAGFQVSEEPERAGRGGVLLHTPDLADVLARLDAAGIVHDEPFDATESQVLFLTDPDDHRVVVTAPFPLPHTA